MEQTTQENSIIESCEFLKETMISSGVYRYLPADKDEPEQTVTFTNIMEDCDTNPELIKAMLDIYQSMKRPLLELNPLHTGEKLLKLVDAIDDIVIEHVAFAAHDEHGVIA